MGRVLVAGPLGIFGRSGVAPGGAGGREHAVEEGPGCLDSHHHRGRGGLSHPPDLRVDFLLESEQRRELNVPVAGSRADVKCG